MRLVVSSAGGVNGNGYNGWGTVHQCRSAQRVELNVRCEAGRHLSNVCYFTNVFYPDDLAEPADATASSRNFFRPPKYPAGRSIPRDRRRLRLKWVRIFVQSCP